MQGGGKWENAHKPEMNFNWKLMLFLFSIPAWSVGHRFDAYNADINIYMYLKNKNFNKNADWRKQSLNWQMAVEQQK